jgi:hypothetical protein
MNELLLLPRFHPNNVLGIRSFADTLGCPPLVTEAEKYIQQYFHNVSMSDEYLNLSCSDLLSIVRRDELHVLSEEQVCGLPESKLILTSLHESYTVCVWTATRVILWGESIAVSVPQTWYRPSRCCCRHDAVSGRP